ncbi:MAG: hypothetical protein M4579_005979 [Chaenotheca gracillima]|nr:MAG: hypothetical protein M4579_005979 [Chaenotheca gracillima]
MSTTRKPGCIPCRERHLKCDRVQPSCSNCAKAKRGTRSCTYPGVKIRQSDFTITEQRPSTRSTPAQAYPSSGNPTDSAVALSPHSTRRSSGASPPPEWLPPQAHHAGYADLARLPLSPPDALPTSSPSLQSPSLAREVSTSSLLTPTSSQNGRPRYGKLITDSLDGTVFEFYIKHGGVWLDIVSAAAHFSRTVPQLALTEPCLRSACCAYASHVMVLQGKLDKAVGERYLDEAIGLLIPLLSSDEVSAKKEILLATTVILRMSEQFAEDWDDAQYHLNGAFSVFTSMGAKWSVWDTSVSGTAFWVYFRQSIRVAILHEQASKCDMNLLLHEDTFTDAPDEVWSNRICLLLAQSCNACWAEPDLVQRQATIDRLRSRLELWKSNLPESFQPWCFVQNKYDPFVTIRYLASWHVLGWQQYYAAKVLIALYSNDRPRDGNLLALNQYMEGEVLHPARLLCAVCFSCDIIGANINGSHLVAFCGQLFNGREEQRILIRWLRNFREETKWPNEVCCERLEQIWRGQRHTWRDP